MGSRWIRTLLVLAASALTAIASAQFDIPGGDPFGGSTGGLGGPASALKVAAKVLPPQGDQPPRLAVTATISPDYHIYSVTQPEGGPVRTTIKLDPSSAFQLAGEFTPSAAPHRKKEPAFDNLDVETHDGTVTWTAPLKVAAGVDWSSLKISGKLNAQPCTNSACLAPTDFAFTAVGGGGAATAASAGGPAYDAASSGGSSGEELPLGLALIFGFIGGAILNLMPCVLPVIGLKVLSFVQQSGENRVQAFLLNLWYSAGVIAVFLVLAGLAVTLGLGWGELFGFQGFQITMAVVVFVMALSFLGVWEVPIPGFVGRGAVGDLAQKEGVAGAFSKGVLTTILATPCSAPFLGTSITWAVQQPPAVVFAVFFAVGLGMASPNLLIGAFPGMARFLPKPGEWMDTFKQIMGFVLLATVVFVLSFVPFTLVVPTVALMFGLWGSCWWIGRMSPLAETATRVRTWVEAAAFGALVWAVSFHGGQGVLPEKYTFSLADYMEQRMERLSDGFSRERLRRLVSSQKTVLVDFTADWCLSCKTFEKLVLNSDATKKALEEGRVVTMRADWTYRDPEVTRMLEWLGSKQVPVIAIFPAGNFDRPIVFRGGYTQQQILEALAQAGPSKI